MGGQGENGSRGHQEHRQRAATVQSEAVRDGVQEDGVGEREQRRQQRVWRQLREEGRQELSARAEREKIRLTLCHRTHARARDYLWLCSARARILHSEKKPVDMPFLRQIFLRGDTDMMLQVTVVCFFLCITGALVSISMQKKARMFELGHF